MTRSLFGKSALFITLGLADLAMTCYLLRTSAGQVYESNPVAHWWLDRWGWAGLAGFKLIMVSFVLVSTWALARYRPRAAANVLAFACGVTALVLAYSGYLLASGRAHGGTGRFRDEVALRAESRVLEAKIRQLQEYENCISRLAEQVRAGHVSLDEAVTRLAATRWARQSVWWSPSRGGLRNCSDPQWLADLLCNYIRALEEERPRDRTAVSWQESGESMEAVGGE
jgi:hypothetical protein